MPAQVCHQTFTNAQPQRYKVFLTSSVMQTWVTRLGWLGALAALGAGSAAMASTVEYTSATSFDAAVSGLTSYNFDAVAPPGQSTYEASPVSVGGVSFTSPGLGFLIAGDAVISGDQYGKSIFSGQGSTSTVTAALAGVTALDFYYGSYTTAAEPITVTLNTGASFQLTTPAQAGVVTNFIGFTSTTPITRITFTGQGDSVDVTQFGVGTAAGSDPPPAVPLPSTAWLLLGGMVALFTAGRRARPIRLSSPQQ